MNALDISKCRLDAVSGARRLACFLVNGAGCSFVHGVFTVSTCGMVPQSGRGFVLRNTKGAWALEYAPAPVSRSLCPCGDQPVPPAGDRAVTSRLSEPPRMPKPARCGRRRLICNRRVLPRCRRCGAPLPATMACACVRAVPSCARHCTYAASPGFAPYDWHFASSSIALRCSISALVAQPLRATSSVRTAGHRVRMSELKIRLRIPPSNIVSPKHRWSHRRAGRLRGVAWRGIDRPNLCLPNVFPAPIFGKIKTHVTVISI